MPGVTRFDDLECYKLACEIRRGVLQFTRRSHVRRDLKFLNQIRDSARGGPRNIAEGYSRFNPTEILQFLSYAKASLDETRNHIIDAVESGYLTEAEAAGLIVLIRRALAAISGWMRYLESPAARAFYASHKARTRATNDSSRKPRAREPRTREP